MENNDDQGGAAVKICDKGAVPLGKGPSTKTSILRTPRVLYTIKLTSKSNRRWRARLNSTYYTIVGNKVYYANSSNGIAKNRRNTRWEMVTCTKNQLRGS